MKLRVRADCCGRIKPGDPRCQECIIWCCGAVKDGSVKCPECQRQARIGDLKRFKSATSKKSRALGATALLLRASREDLWTPIDPAQTYQGFAADPEHLIERLETNPIFAARYWQLIGEPEAPEVSESPDTQDENDDQDDEEDLDDAA